MKKLDFPPSGAPRYHDDLNQGDAVIVAHTTHKYKSIKHGLETWNVSLHMVWVALMKKAAVEKGTD